MKLIFPSVGLDLGTAYPRAVMHLRATHLQAMHFQVIHLQQGSVQVPNRAGKEHSEKWGEEGFLGWSRGKYCFALLFFSCWERTIGVNAL